MPRSAFTVAWALPDFLSLSIPSPSTEPLASHSSPCLLKVTGDGVQGVMDNIALFRLRLSGGTRGSTCSATSSLNARTKSSSCSAAPSPLCLSLHNWSIPQSRRPKQTCLEQYLQESPALSEVGASVSWCPDPTPVAAHLAAHVTAFPTDSRPELRALGRFDHSFAPLVSLL